jgi:hypothetical protein
VLGGVMTWKSMIMSLTNAGSCHEFSREAAALGMPLEDHVAAIIRTDEIYERMLNLFQLGTCISPLLVILPRKYDHFMLRKNNLIAVSQLITFIIGPFLYLFKL